MRTKLLNGIDCLVWYLAELQLSTYHICHNMFPQSHWMLSHWNIRVPPSVNLQPGEGILKLKEWWHTKALQSEPKLVNLGSDKPSRSSGSSHYYEQNEYNNWICVMLYPFITHSSQGFSLLANINKCWLAHLRMNVSKYYWLSLQGPTLSSVAFLHNIQQQ